MIAVDGYTLLVTVLAYAKEILVIAVLILGCLALVKYIKSE